MKLLHVVPRFSHDWTPQSKEQDAVMKQHKNLPPYSAEQTAGILILTNRGELKGHLQGVTNAPTTPAQRKVPCRVDTVITLAGATCHTGLCFQTGVRFLSSDHDQPEAEIAEAYPRACVGLTRAQAITSMVAPLDIRGLPGAMQVTAVLQHGASGIKSKQATIACQMGQR